MLTNYLKIAFRSLWRNKFYAVINILGLSLGIAAVVWGIQTYRYSYSFDNFHTNKDKIFRVLSKAQGSDQLKGICPMPLANAAKLDFSGIQQVVRWDERGLDIKADQNEPFAASANYTDAAFFELFNFPLLKGTVNLNNKSTVVITEKAAEKYFGKIDPIGKILLFHADEPYKKPLLVTGVLKNPPMNSSFQFELITHYDNEVKGDGSILKSDDWSWFANAIFIKVSNTTEVAQLARQLDKYLPLQQEARKDFKITGFELESMAVLALQSNKIDNNALLERPQDSAAFAPLILAMLVLLSACLNFANTSVSQSNRRLKEMGVRKVMGSSRRQIMGQQLLECSMIVFVAIALSVLINKWWLPAFNSMFGFISITADYFNDSTLLLILVAILVSVTLLAGGYPALYISRFNANHIFRGSVKFGGSNLFSKLLLGFQIVVSFITVIAGLAFSRNARFQQTYDYGYDKDNMIGFFVPAENGYQALRNEIKKLPGVHEVAGTMQHISFWERIASLEAGGLKKETKYMEVGENYLNTVKLKLVAGRNFTEDGNGDIGYSMLINQNLAFQFGWKEKEAIGKQIRIDTSVCTVVGVLKDFTPGTLFEPIGPFVLRKTDPKKYAQLIVRTKPGELTKVYNQSKKIWAGLFPLKPFRGYYQSEASAESIRTNTSIASIFFWFAIISVLLAATGLFALMSLTVLKKTKEIAIRKVVGANAKHIYQLVLKGYLVIFFFGAAVGCYAGYTLSRLLMDMIFRINAGVALTTLWVSLACVVFIAGITIGSRVWYALRTKPTDVLKAG